MGKKMGVRGRPGLFFVTILIIFLVIFFLTWKSMMTPKRKAEVKDVYSMNFQSANQGENADNPPHSDFSDIWNQAKLLRGENIHQDNREDMKYNAENSGKFNSVYSKDRNGEVKSPLSALLHPTPQPSVKEKESKPYYMKPNDSLKVIGGRIDRFVHLDLKGAAPKVRYLKQIFPLFSRLGATGLLMEYEDMFPYSGKLQMISAENSYTKDQIKEILDLAKLNSLQVIPLIQTFGHMEFVLKGLKMEGLRESSYTPQVINIASNSSYELIQEMVSQILEAHPTVSYLHVGCDEVYELGRGRSAEIAAKEKLTTESLFLRHVKHVADIVAKTSGNKVRPIIWDDELRKLADEDILAAGLPAAVDIMVWRYTPNITDKLTEAVWMKYGRLFKTVWAASSFKGATGPRQVYTEPKYHIINHFSWMNVIAKYGRHVSFKGIALTGWQRFDHFATLCELLPVAIPSLAVCLATIRNGGFNEEIHRTTSSILGCSGMIEMSFPQLDEKDRKALVTQDCRFPGDMVYYGVQQLWGSKQFEEKARRSGWLSDYQLSHGFSSPGQLKVLSKRLADLDSKLLQVKTPLEENLLQIFTADTVEEWLDENIFEMQREIKQIQDKVSGIAENTHWARRPHLPLVTKSLKVDDNNNKEPGTKAQPTVAANSKVSIQKDVKKIQSLDRQDRQDNVNTKLSNDRFERRNNGKVFDIQATQNEGNRANVNTVLNHNQNLRNKADNAKSVRTFESKKESQVNTANHIESINPLRNNAFIGGKIDVFNKNGQTDLSNVNAKERRENELTQMQQRLRVQNQNKKSNTNGAEDSLKRQVFNTQNRHAGVIHHNQFDNNNVRRLTPTPLDSGDQRDVVQTIRNVFDRKKIKNLTHNTLDLGIRSNDVQHMQNDLDTKHIGNSAPAISGFKTQNLKENEERHYGNLRRQLPENNLMTGNSNEVSNALDEEKDFALDENNGIGHRKKNENILAGMLDKLDNDRIDNNNFDDIHKAVINEMDRDGVKDNEYKAQSDINF